MTTTRSSGVSGLPEIWVDWCSVTGTPVDRRDEPTLRRFVDQARPSHRVLAALRPVHEKTPAAPAWPSAHRDDGDALQLLIRRGDVLVQAEGTHWLVRLRLRRLLFAAVLIAPAEQGGLGLSRRQALGLVPGSFQRLRPNIGVAVDEASCPACAVWSWLQVLGTNNGWSQSAVRALARRPDQASGEHRHLRADASDDWLDCVGILPAIDQWGYVDPYASVHLSSLSVLIRAMEELLDAPADPTPEPEPKPRTGPVRNIDSDEEAQILGRADELNARIAAILDEYR